MQITPPKKKKNVVKLQYWDSVSTPKVYSTHISLKFWEKKKYNHFEKSWDKLTRDKLTKVGMNWFGTNWPVSTHSLAPIGNTLSLTYSLSHVFENRMIISNSTHNPVLAQVVPAPTHSVPIKILMISKTRVKCNNK
jgi:hypothetical protein